MDNDQAAADLELVRGIKAGEDSAFEKMVERYHARVYSLAYGVLRNPEDAEEATQDAFWTLYRKIGTFDESKKFFSWFYRVALNAAYSRARRRPSLPTTSIEDRMPRFLGDGHFAADVPDWSVAIEDEAGEFIAELPPAYRDVIWMYDVEEMPSADIAETLEISIPAFKSRLHRARLYVRQRLSELQGPKPAAKPSATPAAEAAG